MIVHFIHILFYLSLFSYAFILPLYEYWSELKERRMTLQDECQTYRGDNQAFLDLCFLLERDMVSDFIFSWSDVDFQWKLGLLLILEPLYLFLMKIHSKWKIRKERSEWKRREEKNHLAFQSEKSSERITFF